MLDQIAALIDKPRSMAFSALGSKDGSGAGLLNALFGVDPNSTAGQVGGTVADIGLDPLNLVGGLAFTGARRAGRLGQMARKGEAADAAYNSLKGVELSGGAPAMAEKATDAAQVASGRSPLLGAMTDAAPPPSMDLALGGQMTMPDGMGGLMPRPTGGLATAPAADLSLSGGAGDLGATMFPAGEAVAAGDIGRPGVDSLAGLFQSGPKRMNPMDEFFTNLGQTAPRAEPAAGLTPGLSISGDMPMPGSVAPPTRLPPNGVTPGLGQQTPIPGANSPAAVSGGPAAYSEYRVNGDNPLRLGVSSPDLPPAAQPSLMRGDEVLAPRMQGGVGPQAGLPPDILAQIEMMDPLLRSEILASALGGATAGRAGARPFN